MALPERPGVAAETIQRVQRLARESLREARNRVWDMHGTAEGDALPTLLERTAHDRTAGMPVEVAVSTAGSVRPLPRSLEDAAFRIGREAIVNALRHAEADRIEIHIDYRPRTFSLEVRDDGRGFTPADAEAARARGHLGITGIRERAAQLGGRCDFQPRPGGGTIVTLELPLE